MENLLYILVVVAYFIYQTYNNFKKEQEKARKRNVNIPQEGYNIPEEVEIKPIIEKATEAVELKPDYKLTKKESRIKERREELVYEKMQREEPLRDYYNPEMPYRESNKKKATLLAAKVSVNTSRDDFNEEKREYNFDLRDAIIKEAILKRPY